MVLNNFSTKTKKAGTKKTASTVAEIMPPSTPVPMAFWLAALGPKQAGRFLDMLAVLERRLREMLTEDPQAPPPLPASSVRRRSAAVDLALVERLHAALTQVIEDAGSD